MITIAGTMITIAGGIILAVLFFVFLPLILRLVVFAVGALLWIAIVGLVGYGIVYAAANSTLPTLHDVLTGVLTIGIVMAILTGIPLICYRFRQARKADKRSPQQSDVEDVLVEDVLTAIERLQ